MRLLRPPSLSLPNLLLPRLLILHSSGLTARPRSPFVAGISFTLCSSLSQSLYKGLGAGVGGGRGELDPNWLSPPGRDQSGAHAPSR